MSFNQKAPWQQLRVEDIQACEHVACLYAAINEHGSAHTALCFEEVTCFTLVLLLNQFSEYKLS